MSQNTIRKDKTCLNCRHVVENKFCPNCGQENSDTRKTFHHLFIHFFEDLTHYENAFWRTIKNLLFSPASLTKEYLSGKRLSYLAPVRLYIFISFVTFFLISVFPSEDATPLNPEKATDDNDSKQFLKSEYVSENLNDSVQKIITESKKNKYDPKGDFDFGFDSVQQLDSLKKFGKGNDKLNEFEYWFFKKIIKVKENNSSDEILQKGKESLLHNFPKVLLIYMPLFALFLWVFHGKKRWYYFDHGIFTLHYFSFLLLIYLLIFICIKFVSLFEIAYVTDAFNTIIFTVGSCWMFYYFFPAHHRFYGETKRISFLKSSVLFIINMIFILILLSLYFVYTLINIH